MLIHTRVIQFCLSKVPPIRLASPSLHLTGSMLTQGGSIRNLDSSPMQIIGPVELGNTGNKGILLALFLQQHIASSLALYR